MGTTTIGHTLLPETELARIARVLARFLAGRQPGLTATQSAGQLPGQGLDFLDFRQYQGGDDFRSIDWRASARSSRLQVRRYSGDLSSDWYLCVDASASMGVQTEASQVLSRQLSAALAYVLLHLGHRVGLLMFSASVDAACPLGRGYGQYARILRTLNAQAPGRRGGGSDLGACAAALGRNCPVLVVSDFLAEDAMVTSLAKLLAGQRPLHLFALNDATQCQLPGVDSLLLEDVETGRTVIAANVELAQSGAERRLLALRAELSAWCARFGVPLTQYNSDDNWRDLLLRHFTPG